MLSTRFYLTRVSEREQRAGPHDHDPGRDPDRDDDTLDCEHALQRLERLGGASGLMAHADVDAVLERIARLEAAAAADAQQEDTP